MKNSQRVRENAIIEAAASIITERRMQENKLRARKSENAPYYNDLHEIVLGEVFGRQGASAGDPIHPEATEWLDGVDTETGEPLVFVYKEPAREEDRYCNDCLLGIYVIKPSRGKYRITLVPWKHERSYKRGSLEFGRTLLDMDDAEMNEFAPRFNESKKKLKENTERQIEYCYREYTRDPEGDVPRIVHTSFPEGTSDEDILEELDVDEYPDYGGDDFIFYVKDEVTGKVLFQNPDYTPLSWIRMCVEEEDYLGDPRDFIDAGWNYDFLKDMAKKYKGQRRGGEGYIDRLQRYLDK